MLPNCNYNFDATITSNHFQKNSTNSVITCCYQNIRSIVNKLSLFQSYVYSSNFDVICLTETWLTESVFDQEILPTNYNIFRKDRSTRGGGVLIATKSSIPVSVVHSDPLNNALEILTVRLNLSKPVTLSCVYISPNPSDSYMYDLISNLTQVIQSNPSTDIIITGDFNLPEINWDNLSTTSTTSSTFCDFVFDNSLTQLIDQPTHVRSNILDLVLSNSEELVTNLTVSSNNSWISSDHFVITFQLAHELLHTPSTIPKYVYDLPKANYSAIQSFLFDFEYSPCLQSQDVEFIWHEIKSSIHNAMNMFIPKVRLRRRQFPCWFTPELRHLSKCLHSTKKRFTKHATPHLQLKLNNLESKYRSKVLLAKSNYESELVQSFAGSQNSKIYDYIRSLSKKSPIPSSVSLDNTSATSDTGKAELFNTFFHSVFTGSPFSLPDMSTLLLPPSCICSVSFTESEVFDALSSLDASKSSGCDGIGSKLIKDCALALYLPVHHLFSLSLSKQSIPYEWKCHSITPIFKSGDKSQVKNYRPISLLCVISKVLEHLIFNKISKFIITNNILYHHQFGFRQQHSTTQQLLVFLNDVLSALNDPNCSQCDIIYLDFKKAFDSVPHQELLMKLWKTGIVGSLWKWFSEYLSNRYQYVCINNCKSSTLPVVSGVPQGSILGPFLFLIYINDLSSSMKYSKTFLFADDTKCFRPIRSPQDHILLQSDLDVLSLWSTNWKLMFNETKCSIMSIFSHPSLDQDSDPQTEYLINGLAILPCKQQKDLGILVSSDLSWSDHVSRITSKAYKILRLLRRTFTSQINVTTKKKLYIALVRSQLTYASQIWRPMLLKDLYPIEHIQRRATKYILNDYTSDYRSRLIMLNLLPMSMLFELNDICFFVRSIQLCESPNHSFNISRYTSFSPNNTRSGTYKKLVQPPITHNRDKHFYFNRLPHLWNSLPPIDLSLSLVSIKKELKEIFWKSFLAKFNPDVSCSYYFSCPCPRCFSQPKSCF